MTAVTITAAVVVTPVALLSGGPLGAVHAHDWLWLALFVLGGSGGHLLVAWAHPRVDVTVSSLLLLSQPVISGVAALIVLGEPLTPLEIVGGAVVIVSVAAIVRHATRAGSGEDIAAPEGAPA
jgi:drug/metabolite transporter (DMT)-like permease